MSGKHTFKDACIAALCYKKGGYYYLLNLHLKFLDYDNLKIIIDLLIYSYRMNSTLYGYF